MTTAKPPTNLALYTYYRSSSSWRVRICLAIKGLSYESNPIHLVKAEQRADSYVKDVNGMKQVPALSYTYNGKKHIATQSMAIINFLEQAFPPNLGNSDTLYRKDVEGNAFSFSVAEIINSGIQPLQNLYTCQKISKDSDGALIGRAFGKDCIIDGLQTLEAMVLDRWAARGDEMYVNSEFPTAKFYVLGVDTGDADECGPTIGDACLIPQLYNARRFDVDLTPYKCLLKIEESCLKHEAFIEAQPDMQEDCPEADKNKRNDKLREEDVEPVAKKAKSSAEKGKKN